jgi:hypothetical protein
MWRLSVRPCASPPVTAVWFSVRARVSSRCDGSPRRGERARQRAPIDVEARRDAVLRRRDVVPPGEAALGVAPHPLARL